MRYVLAPKGSRVVSAAVGVLLRSARKDLIRALLICGSSKTAKPPRLAGADAGLRGQENRLSAMGRPRKHYRYELLRHYAGHVFIWTTPING